jgi:ketopantoate reductase
MKVCIYGEGAIGSYLGVLAPAGAGASLIVRGAHLAAMKANGLKLLIGDEAYSFDPATRALPNGIMRAVQSITETFGVNFHVDVERRIESACKVDPE